METVFDPLRQKEVPRTPEEAVRQWFIGILAGFVGVPYHMMMSEASMKWGKAPYERTLRADILVYDRSGSPLMIVECKRPEVTIDAKVALQASIYNEILEVRYIALTNGKQTFFFERKEGGFEAMSSLPLWKDIS